MLSCWQSVWSWGLLDHRDSVTLIQYSKYWIVNFCVHRGDYSSHLNLALEHKSGADRSSYAYTLAHQRVTAWCFRSTRFDPSARMVPPLLLLILNDEVVTHYNEVTVNFSVTHTFSHNIAKCIETRSKLSWLIFCIQFVGVLEESQEPHWFNNLNEVLLQQFSVAVQVRIVNSHKQPLSQGFVSVAHSSR